MSTRHLRLGPRFIKFTCTLELLQMLSNICSIDEFRGRVVDWSIEGLKTASGASGIDLDNEHLMAPLSDDDEDEEEEEEEVDVEEVCIYLCGQNPR